MHASASPGEQNSTSSASPSSNLDNVSPAVNPIAVAGNISHQAANSEGVKPSEFEEKTADVVSEETISFSIFDLANKWPAELSLLLNKELPDTTQISIPVRLILPQLSKGMVKLSLAEFQSFSPPGLFVQEPSVPMIVLPLDIVLSKINQGHLSRRPNQQKAVIADDISAPFQVPVKEDVAPLQPEVIQSSEPLPIQPIENQEPVSQTAPADDSFVPFAFDTPQAGPVIQNELTTKIEPVSETSTPEPSTPAAVADSVAIDIPPPAEERSLIRFSGLMPPVEHSKEEKPPEESKPEMQMPSVPFGGLSLALNDSPVRASVAVPPETEPKVQPIKAASTPAPVVSTYAKPVIPSHSIYQPPLPAISKKPPLILPRKPRPGAVSQAADIKGAVEQKTVESGTLPSPSVENAAVLQPQQTAEPDVKVKTGVSSDQGIMPLIVPVTSEPVISPLKPERKEEDQDVVCISLLSVVGAWPAEFRETLFELITPDHAIHFPVEILEKEIKKGKITFPWSQLQSWIKPAIGTLSGLMTDTVLSVPLQKVVPIFMARKTSDAGRKQVAVGQDIPDLFVLPSTSVAEEIPAQTLQESPSVLPSEGLQSTGNFTGTGYSAEPAVPVVPLPKLGLVQDVSQPVIPIANSLNVSPPVDVPAAQPMGIGDLFGQPGKTSWTPMEMVQNAARLNGFSGALIALEDGLMVSAKLPPELSGEMMAAFLPQLFNRLSHYTKEMRLGPPDSVTVMVDGLALRIEKAGHVFFVAVGRKGEPLPQEAISIVVGHLKAQSGE